MFMKRCWASHRSKEWILSAKTGILHLLDIVVAGIFEGAVTFYGIESGSFWHGSSWPFIVPWRVFMKFWDRMATICNFCRIVKNKLCDPLCSYRQRQLLTQLSNLIADGLGILPDRQEIKYGVSCKEGWQRHHL
jgi:hypothetical protein